MKNSIKSNLRRCMALFLAVILAASVLSIAGSAQSTSPKSSGEMTETEDTPPAQLAETIENGTVFDCTNWTIPQVNNEIPNIAAAGFNTVLVSPLQPHSGSGHWSWVCYSVTDFCVGNELCTEEQLRIFCANAKRYGVHVMVTVEAHFLSAVESAIPDYLRKSAFYHNSNYDSDGYNNKQIPDWTNRYQCTQMDMSGRPDLNTENKTVQGYVLRYIKQLKDCGVDGIFWDCAETIALPSEGSDFWKAVTNSGLYNCANLLETGGPVAKEYSNYLHVAYHGGFGDNVLRTIRENVGGGYYSELVVEDEFITDKNILPNRIMYRCNSIELHFNSGESSEMSDAVINKSYAILASRADSQVTYSNFPHPNTP